MLIRLQEERTDKSSLENDIRILIESYRKKKKKKHFRNKWKKKFNKSQRTEYIWLNSLFSF